MPATNTLHVPGPDPTVRRAPGLRRAILGLHGLIAVNAVYGGVGLMANGMGMPDEWLERTPFRSWVLPGVALLSTVAVPQAVALVEMARDADEADTVSMAAGVGLVAWIAVQVAVLRRYFFLQPIVAGCGVAEAVLAGMRSRRR